MTPVSYISTLRADMAKAITDSPLMRAENIGLVFPEPIQHLREIRASGFDAIVQMTDVAMLSALSRSLGSSRMIQAPIPADLDTALIDELTNRVSAQRIEAEFISWPPSPRRVVVVDLEPSALQVRLSPSTVQVSHGTSPTASIHFSVSLNVVATETAASYESRVDRPSFPPLYRDSLPVGSEPVITDIPVTSVMLEVSGPARTRIDEIHFRVDVDFDFTSANVNSLRSSVWDTKTLEFVMPLIRGLGSRFLLPSICLFGDPPSNPVPDATRFEVTVLGLPSNQLGSLLSFCIETVSVTSAPDPSLVGAFTGSCKFAFFATAPVIQGTVLSRWRSLPQRELERTVPMTIEQDGIRREASARVRYMLGDAYWATMSYGTEFMSDNILISATFTSQALSARLGGRDISRELGDLANPRETREMFRVFANHSPVQQKDETVENWLLGIGRHLLPPLLRPVSSSWALQGDYETQVSTPLSAMVTRGVLV